MRWTNIFKWSRRASSTKVSLEQEATEPHTGPRSSTGSWAASDGDVLSPLSPGRLGVLGSQALRPRAGDIPHIANGQLHLARGPMPSGQSRTISDGFGDADLPPTRVSPATSKSDRSTSDRSTSQDSTPTAPLRAPRRSEEMLRPTGDPDGGTVSPIDLPSVLLHVQEGAGSRATHRSATLAPPRALLPAPRDVPKDARPPFGAAIEAADAAALAALLDVHPDAGRIWPWGDAGSLLHAAAEEGGAEIVELLLDKGCADVAVVDDDGQTALHVAVANGHLDATRALVASPEASGLLTLRDKFKMSPFHLACEGGDPLIVRLLLSRLHASGERPSVVRDLRRGSANFLARQHNHRAIVEMLESARSSSICSRNGSSSIRSRGSSLALDHRTSSDPSGGTPRDSAASAASQTASLGSGPLSPHGSPYASPHASARASALAPVTTLPPTIEGDERSRRSDRTDSGRSDRTDSAAAAAAAGASSTEAAAPSPANERASIGQRWSQRAETSTTAAIPIGRASKAEASKLEASTTPAIAIGRSSKPPSGKQHAHPRARANSPCERIKSIEG